MRILLILLFTMSVYSADYTIKYSKDGNVSILHINADSIEVISGGVATPPNPYFEPQTIDQRGLVSLADLLGNSNQEIINKSVPTNKRELILAGIQRFGPQIQNLLGDSVTQPEKVFNRLSGYFELYNTIKAIKGDNNGKSDNNPPVVSSGNDRSTVGEARKVTPLENIVWYGARREYLIPENLEKIPVTINITSKKAKHLWFDDPPGNTDGVFIIGFQEKDGIYEFIPKTETHAGEGNKASTAFWKRHRKKKPTHAMVYARDYSARSAIFELEV